MTASTKQRLAYDALRQRILDGTFGPGYRIVMDQVARALGVSAVPVREAIRRLEAEGWLTYEPNVGARVVPLDPGRFEQTVTTLALLEGLATAMAAPHLGAADLARARSLVDAMHEAVADGNPIVCARLNEEFHDLLTGPCDNAYLMELTRQARDRMKALRRSALLLAPSRALEEHAAIVDLIERGAAADEIESLARAHRLRSIEEFRRVMTAGRSWSAGATP